MRLLTLSALTVLASTLAVAADFTYLGGSLKVLLPASGGTLSYRSGKAIELKTPLHKIAIPYREILSAELGEVHTPVPDPLYKVWSLHKRFANRETQELTVAYKDKTGLEQTVTLELARDEAGAMLEAIQDRDEWWGDQFWKTTRNAKQWNGK